MRDWLRDVLDNVLVELLQMSGHSERLPVMIAAPSEARELSFFCSSCFPFKDGTRVGVNIHHVFSMSEYALLALF